MQRLDVRSAAKLITDALAEDTKERKLVAIDGRCASGKTSLAAELERMLGCTVIHMDDFFLRSEQRTEKRLAEPGGNIDRERFLSEVLVPLTKGKEFSYRPFVCRTMTLGDPIAVRPSAVTVIEGSYSCHPELRNFYDLRIFTDVDPVTQIKRVAVREGEKKAEQFKSTWIPLEERYFEQCRPDEICDLLFELI